MPLLGFLWREMLLMFLRSLGVVFSILIAVGPLQECEGPAPDPTPPTTAPPGGSLSQECIDSFASTLPAGVAAVSARIVGDGTDANRACRSYTVMLSRDGIFCGGTLISDEWVLSAAHCLPNNDPFTVRVGAYATANIDGTEFDVAEVVRHPDHGGAILDPGWYKDFALIRLDGTADPSMIRAALPTPEIDAEYTQVGRKLLVTGWGISEQLGGPLPEVLQEAPLEVTTIQPGILPGAVCWMATDASTICFNDATGASSCKGDSGGPAATVHNGRVYVFGASSFGSGDCSSFNGYARVASEVPWITSVTGIEPVG